MTTTIPDGLVERLRGVDVRDAHELYVSAPLLGEAAEALTAAQQRIAELEGENAAWLESAVKQQKRARSAEAALSTALKQGEAERVRKAAEDDETLDRVADAIDAARCPHREGPFGLYNYQTGISHPVLKPHCVRDFRDSKSQSFGSFILCTEDREEAKALYERLTRHHIAKAAIRALLPDEEKPGSGEED